MNVLDHEFSRPAPNQARVGDITYVQTAGGWLYLAVSLAPYSRRVSDVN